MNNTAYAENILLQPSGNMQEPALDVCTLARGSRGNSVYVASGDTAILIDAGLSCAEITRRLSSKNLSAEKISAIVISHEHTDHISAAFVFSKKYRVPVYASRATMSAIGDKKSSFHEIREFACGKLFRINSLEIQPFSISHDAADPSGFTVSAGSRKMGIATDLGIATSLVKTRLTGCSLVMVESNYDPVMLAAGPYPWSLKQRVKGRLGHLSNREAKELVSEIVHPELRHVIIGHLSGTNNSPEIAFGTVSEALKNSSVRLSLASQDSASDVFCL